MGSWAGAIVETRGRADFAALAARHRITVTGDVTPWLLVQGEVPFSHLHPPVFAEALSRELQGTVIAFFVQTTSSVEQVAHWKDGKLVRKLEYSGEAGGWVTQQGKPQKWEPAYFFDENDDGQVPVVLDDESLKTRDRNRYKRARASLDATGIMDLLSGGSTEPLRRLCKHFGLDPDQPGARSAPPASLKKRLLVAAVAVLGGLALLARHLSR